MGTSFKGRNRNIEDIVRRNKWRLAHGLCRLCGKRLCVCGLKASKKGGNRC